MNKKGIGFIGIGNMGKLMAGRFLEAGFPLTIFDQVKSQTDDLAMKGAKVVGSPKEVATQSEVIITMIPDGLALKNITFGDNGILVAAKSGSILIDMSTVDPVSSDDVAQAAETKGVKMLRAPVSGSTILAADGKLTIFVSGDKQTYDNCHDILGIMGHKIFWVGTGDEARYLKLAMNMMVGSTLQMLAEALVFGEKAGLDWEQLLDLIANSVAASPLVGYKVGPLARRNFEPAFTVDNMAKDLDLALVAGKKIGAPMPTTALVREFLGMLQATGRGKLDFSALVLIMEEVAGVKH